MIKVAFLTKNLDIGGIERAILNYLNYMDKLKYDITLFLDEGEASIIGMGYDVDEMVITNASKGSRIISQEGEIKIDAVECQNVVDTTGCGDTYMAAYISYKLLSNSSKKAGNFASKVSSEKISNFGPYKFNK